MFLGDALPCTSPLLEITNLVTHPKRIIRQIAGKVPISPMTHADRSSAESPAILGGKPVCSDGPPGWPPDDPAVKEALRKAVSDGSWGAYHGPHCAALIEQMRSDLGCENVVLCASGTVAVELALRGLKIGDGDEVILAAYEFKGNFQNVLCLGARPVLIDIDPHSWNLNPSQIEAAIGPRTRAIIATHLHGGVVPMPAVMEIAAAAGLAVIEDACQMPGAVIAGRPAGLWGDVGVQSFGGSKLLCAGRGGALFTNRAEIVQRARLYSHRGNEAYPLSELQAAVLVPQWNQLGERNRKRTENVHRLCKMLADLPGLVPLSSSIPQTTPGYYKLGFQYDPQAFDGLSRDQFAEAMRAEGIAVDPGFRSLHTIHSQRRFRQVGDLSVATRADERVLTLHHPVLLGEPDQIEQIVTAIEKVRRHASQIATHCNR